MTEHPGEQDHEHTRTCFGHDSHWMDDSVYVNEGPEGAADCANSTKDLVKLLSSELPDEKIYRFALVTVDDKGFIQLSTSPGMAHDNVVNLLSRAISILAVQRGIDERNDRVDFLESLGEAVGMAMTGDGEMPDLTVLLGGEPFNG
jgi:hypothetical protein